MRRLLVWTAVQAVAISGVIITVGFSIFILWRDDPSESIISAGQQTAREASSPLLSLWAHLVALLVATALALAVAAWVADRRALRVSHFLRTLGERAERLAPGDPRPVPLNSGIEEAYRSIIPSELLPVQDYVFPASCAAPTGTVLDIRSSGDAGGTVWFAPAGTSNFVEGGNMTRAAGDATSIAVPATPGNYRLFVVDAQGQTRGESAALLRVTGG